jgi:hypothetical protein
MSQIPAALAYLEPRLFLQPALVLLTGFVLMCGGCGEPNPLGRRAVYGVVSFQGQPVATGSILFSPEDTQRGVNSGAMIAAGKYFIEESKGLPPGTYHVMISSPDASQQTKVEGPPGDERVLAAERIPAQYNLKTTLKVEVPKSRGRYEANFDLR